MTGFLDRLNLRPQEKRLLVVVASIVFVVIHVVFVQPRFKDWAQIKGDLDKTEKRLKLFQAEIERTPTYQVRLKKLEGEGSAVLPEDQANNLVRAINSQATQSRVVTTSVRPKINPRGPNSANVATNQFFEEQTVYVGVVNTGDKELVDFLVALSSGDLMVRVRDLDLKPDPTSGHSRLMGNITLVASYQKKAKSSPPTTRKP